MDQVSIHFTSTHIIISLPIGHGSFQSTSKVLPPVDTPHKLKLEAFSDSLVTKKAEPTVPAHPHSAKTTPTKASTLKWPKPSLLSFNMMTNGKLSGNSSTGEFAVIGHSLRSDTMMSESQLFTTGSSKLMLDLGSDVELSLSLPLYNSEQSIREKGGVFNKSSGARRQRLPRIRTASRARKKVS